MDGPQIPDLNELMRSYLARTGAPPPRASDATVQPLAPVMERIAPWLPGGSLGIAAGKIATDPSPRNILDTLRGVSYDSVSGGPGGSHVAAGPTGIAAFDRFSPMAEKQARAFIGRNPHLKNEMDDAVQEAQLKLFDLLDKHDLGDDPEGFIAKSINNHLQDKFIPESVRVKKTDSITPREDSEGGTITFDPEAKTANPETAAIASQTTSAFDKISDPLTREILIRRAQDESYPSIAKDLRGKLPKDYNTPPHLAVRNIFETGKEELRKIQDPNYVPDAPYQDILSKIPEQHTVVTGKNNNSITANVTTLSPRRAMELKLSGASNIQAAKQMGISERQYRQLLQVGKRALNPASQK